MKVSIIGIILNILLVIGIIILIIVGLSYRANVQQCQSNQSFFCYEFVCPCDSQTTGPCRGYGFRPGPRPNTFYCIDAPLSLVDAQGKVIS